MEPEALIYDDSCPLCRWYSHQFVQHGLLAGRIPFSDCHHSPAVPNLDWDRARHEIALHDFATGQTRYGLDSLVYLLGRRVPLVAWGAKLLPVRWFFGQLYAFVSYNRRVIVPTPPAHTSGDCAPDFHLGYRAAFIAVAWGLATAIGLGVAWTSGWGLLLAWLGLGLVVVQGSALALPGQRGWDLAGQLAASLLVGSLALLPFWALMAWLGTGTGFSVLGTLMSLMVMAAQVTWRLSRLAGTPAPLAGTNGPRC
jgi:predicted DCC family thiol-disulfide oxidoreductase YuxK